jgi:hypothetical protein
MKNPLSQEDEMKTSPAELALRARMISRWENEGGATDREGRAPKPAKRSPRPEPQPPPSGAVAR